uniref:Uncharacterized protein n=1 Tax=Nitzschia supralitorea TaxID=303403 RepID=A0A8F1B7Y2_9STRA|nr:hypothetical protein KYU99_pgp068 [Nitzschia supralitorea]QWM93175.1 hypothetical protein [Nitzschia supralitorea]
MPEKLEFIYAKMVVAFQEGTDYVLPESVIILINVVADLPKSIRQAQFPNKFLRYKNIYDLQIKLKVIETISTVFLEKVFNVEVFLEQFNVSTKKKQPLKAYC